MSYVCILNFIKIVPKHFILQPLNLLKSRKSTFSLFSRSVIVFGHKFLDYRVNFARSCIFERDDILLFSDLKQQHNTVYRRY